MGLLDTDLLGEIKTPLKVKILPISKTQGFIVKEDVTEIAGEIKLEIIAKYDEGTHNIMVLKQYESIDPVFPDNRFNGWGRLDGALSFQITC